MLCNDFDIYYELLLYVFFMRKLIEIFRMIKDVNFFFVFGFINIFNVSFYEFVKIFILLIFLRSLLFSIEIMDIKINKIEDFI